MASEWGAAAAVVMAVLALATAAIGYGMMRQKVDDLSDRANQQHDRLDGLDARQDKLAKDVGDVTRTHDLIGEQIRSFASQTEAGHKLLANQIQALDRLFSSKMDDVLAELRRRRGRSGDA